MKVIAGYVRENQTGIGIPNRTVTIRYDDASALPVPEGGMIMAAANPVSSGADGGFQWTTELSPGPVKLEADVVDGLEVQVRSGKEMMQIGDIFVSDLDKILLPFADGVIWVTQIGMAAFVVSPVTGQRQVSVAAGTANMRGRWFQTDTPRTLSLDANTTLATRIDRVVLEQHIAGPYEGRQNIAIIKGTVSGTVPPSNQDPNVFQLPLAEVTIPLNATSVTVTDRRVFAYPHYLNIPAGYIKWGMLNADVTTQIDAAAASWPGLGVRQNGGSGVTGIKILNAADGMTRTDDGGGQVTLRFTPPTGSITSAMIQNGTVTETNLADDLFKTRRLIDIFPPTHRLKTTAVAHRIRSRPTTAYDTDFTMQPGTPLHRFTEDSVTNDGYTWYYCYVQWRGFGWVAWISNDFEVYP